MKLPKTYEASKYESDIYKLWEKSRVFTPNRASRKDSYCIMMPLPNANGRLHLGSVLFITLQDIVSRYQRMRGKEVLWLPGADHAGFETWVVYEKKLIGEGKTRFDYSREDLYQQVWDFVAGFRKTFENQFREMGASVDWDRFTFSLDDKIVRQVYGTFKKMWDEGLIYRGVRIVNYCTFHGTGFADIEVEYKDIESKLWQIAYPLTSGGGEVVVATTRPETMLGDVAVAVHPDDKRYKEYVGKTLKLPLTNREIPVIADGFVDMKFGTGAVKLTPAHDPTDFEAAGRHDLPMITVIDHEGKMTHEVPEVYRGLSPEEARRKVVADLEKGGYIRKVQDYTHSVGHCYKCGNVIQPLLRDQWFIDMKPLAARAIETLEAKKINFYPDSKRTQLIRYLKGLRDWNISRQIAWGIPIPAFQNVVDPDDWIFDERVGEEVIKFGTKTYRRDPDVFDTWFSSGQWPFATLGIGSQDFKQFYPTSLMETGGEILYPWVSRMIMLGLYMTSEIPFEKVYIHGYVLAEDGAKMSKSLGNVIDPGMMRLKYGADALRLGIIDGRAPAVNRPFDETKARAGRNFANKLWNIARYIQDTLENGPDDAVGVPTNRREGKIAPKTVADHYILNKLSIAAGAIDKALASFRFSEAYDILYHYVWDDFADWYIEASKVEPNTGVLNHVLESTLKLAHPFAPFITETIWQNAGKKSLLAAELWPEIVKADKAKARQFEELKKIIIEVREISAAMDAKKPLLYFRPEILISANSELIKRLGRLKSVEEVRGVYPSAVKLVRTRFEAWLDVGEGTVKTYLIRLKDRHHEIKKYVGQLEERLENKSYIQRAPKKLVEETKAELIEKRLELETIQKEINLYEKFIKG